MGRLSPGQGELLRRALGKNNEAEIQRLQVAFLEGAARNGVRAPIAAVVFEQMRAFGGNSFPKSHAAAFAIIVYQSAWLKHYAPEVYFWALLNNHYVEQISTHQAVWFHNGQPPVPIRFILIRDVAGKFDPQALLSTDLTLDPLDILVFFKRRWQMEPTFRHLREHLGMETQRQWSDKAIARTTPALLGLFSLVTVLAHSLLACHHLSIPTAAWYPKPQPTFSDALALVRSRLWLHLTFQMSADDADMVKVPRVLLERFNDLLAYAT